MKTLSSFIIVILCTLMPSARAADCFADKAELKTAVDSFIGDGCSDSNNCNNAVVQKYGWPMGTWCVSQVTDMADLFLLKSTFNDNISAWDVSKVTDMNAMFSFAESFNQDISSWDVSKVTFMSAMFTGASAFNQDLSSWKVSALDDMVGTSGMFAGTAVGDTVPCSWSDDWYKKLKCGESSSSAAMMLRPTVLLVSFFVVTCLFM